MAFSAEELRVLRRALAVALRTAPDDVPAADAHEYARLTAAVDEAVREGDRLRAFLLADLARYRDALPGTAADYLDRLAAALDHGYPPAPDDLAAVRRLCRLPCTPAESCRREGVRRRCEELAERAVRDRFAGRTPGPRVRLLALPGGRGRGRGGSALAPVAGERGEDEPGPERRPSPGAAPRPGRPARPAREEPSAPAQPSEPGRPAGPARPSAPERDRKVPTPAEVFPPRRREPPPQQRVRPVPGGRAVV
ncbi:hypothetical protein [Streptantibioticus cattleyicolor]|nr:hypothetical protein [Streptomyces sp. SID5468]CCB75330.1 conserved protein of unknown function [Streptantibioticus cattleyicolor NRRL 8057 = DSM 46488]